MPTAFDARLYLSVVTISSALIAQISCLWLFQCLPPPPAMPLSSFFAMPIPSLGFLIYLWILPCCYFSLQSVSLFLPLPFPSPPFASSHLWVHIFTKLFSIMKHYAALYQVKMAERRRGADAPWHLKLNKSHFFKNENSTSSIYGACGDELLHHWDGLPVLLEVKRKGLKIFNVHSKQKYLKINLDKALYYLNFIVACMCLYIKLSVSRGGIMQSNITPFNSVYLGYINLVQVRSAQFNLTA